MFDFILMVYGWFIVLVGTIVVGVLNAYVEREVVQCQI